MVISSLEEILDNTKSDVNELGVFKFGKIFFPDIFAKPFAEFHKEIAGLLFKLLDPSKQLVVQRQAYALLPRESGKTNICTLLFPLYLIYTKGHSIFVNTDILKWTDEQKEEYKHLIVGNNVEIPMNEDFILVNSQTLNRAEGFVTTLKNIIESRNDLAAIFGEKDPRIITEANEFRRKISKIWRVNSFITKDSTIVMAVGSSQHIRGVNILGRRPSFIIADDIYSEENTRSDELRDKVGKIFWSELVNTASTEKGKILLVGTLLHPDTVFKDVRESNNWFGVEKRIISVPELSKLIEIASSTGDFVVPSYEACADLDKELNTLLWKEYKGSYFILSKYYESLLQRKKDRFYQEFMNEPVPPDEINITVDNFYKTAINTWQKDDKQFIEFTYQGIHYKGIINLYVGLDPASSVTTRADDTAIVTAGIARCYPVVKGIDLDSLYDQGRSGRIFPVILEIEGGKYAVTDFKGMKGMAEALLRLDSKYIVSYINIESAGQQEQIVREIMKCFYDNSEEAQIIRERSVNSPHPRSTNIWSIPVSSQTSKSERILSVLLPVIQRYGVVICNSIYSAFLDNLVEQVVFMGSMKHDDYADAWHIAMKEVKLPDASALPYGLIRNEERQRAQTRYQQLVKQYGKRAWLFN